MDIFQNIKRVVLVLRSLAGLASNGDVVSVVFHFYGKNRHLYFEYKSKRWFWRRTKHRSRFTLFVGRTVFKTELPQIKKHQTLFSSKRILVYCNDDSYGHLLDIDLVKQCQLLALARDIGGKLLSGAEPTLLSLNADETVSVCVAIWKDGQIRGSMMASAYSLEDAVKQGIVRALHDARWKPIASEEWSQTQIEITVYSPLKVSVDSAVVRSIDYTKGYIARFGQRVGLYVPEAFNTVRFQNRQEFFNSLLTQKGGFNSVEANEAQIFQFNVIDFIESEKGGGNSLLLRATMPKPLNEEKLKLDRVKNVVEGAISWLKKIQETDGNIVPITRPFHKSFIQIDWGRLNFVLFALAEWRKVDPANTTVNEILQSALIYSESLLIRRIRKENKPTTELLFGLVYLAHARVSLEENEKAQTLLDIVLNNIHRHPFQSILCLETITLAHRLGRAKEVEELEEWCKKEFLIQKESSETDVASWAEAVVVFQASDKQFASSVADWIITHQAEDGSFRQSQSNNFHYTRGTAKIFEALSINRSDYETTLAKAHNWLSSMQYNESNTYFVDPAFRPYLYGGMRHDYNNPDAWIDSVGHYILGASRLYERNGS